MKARGWWLCWSSPILVALASISRCEYILISGFVRLRSSRLSYLLGEKKNKSDGITEVITGFWQSLSLKIVLTSSFCSAPRSEKLQFQQRKCRCEQRHLRRKRHCLTAHVNVLNDWVCEYINFVRFLKTRANYNYYNMVCVHA